MKLTVKTLKGRHFQITVHPNDTIMAVKKSIEDVQGKDNYPCGQQLLVHNGKVLNDESTLAENKVSEDGFLVIMLSKRKTRGSSGSTSSQPAAEARPIAPSNKVLIKKKMETDGSKDEGLIVCKRPKYDSKAKPDRLTELPDYLLVEILSLLPMEEAVRTEVLSTRWKNLWKHMHTIVPRECFVSRRLRNFLSFVDHTLMQCVCPKTFSLRISFHINGVYFHSLRHLLGRWLQWLYSRKVENLTIRTPEFSYTPPDWFYHNSNLVRLEIYFWNFTIHGPDVSWNSLRSLSLDHVTIGDEEFAKILSGCPLLENLDLCDVRFNSLNIMSPRLVKLSVTYYSIYIDWGLLEINAPWLQVLKLSDLFRRGIVRLVDVSSLVHANLNIDNEDDLLLDVATQLLEKVHHVPELTIGKYFIPALSLFKLWGKPCPLFKCKRLTFTLAIFKHELPGISHVLQNSHHLETLVIEVRKCWGEEIHDEINESIDFEGATYFTSMESGDFPHLKSIEITYLCDYDLRYDDQEHFIFELVAYILRKAPALEKLVIIPQEGFCRCFRHCVRKGVSVLSHKLLQFFLDAKGVGEWKLKRKNNLYFEIIFK